MKHFTYVYSLGRNDPRIVRTCGQNTYCKLTRRDTELTAREQHVASSPTKEGNHNDG